MNNGFADDRQPNLDASLKWVAHCRRASACIRDEALHLSAVRQEPRPRPLTAGRVSNSGIFYATFNRPKREPPRKVKRLQFPLP